MSRPLAALNAVVRVNGSTLQATSWRPSAKGVMLDAASFESGGFSDDIGGQVSCTVAVQGWWDRDANMFDAPLNILPNNILTNVELYVNGVGSPAWAFPSAIVESVEQPVELKDRVLYSFTFRNKGAFSAPTGTT